MASVAARVALVFAVGVVGGAELGKVPIALPLLSRDFGLSLVEGGLLLGMFQIASMAVGVFAGMLADRFGQRRVMITGLLIAGLASAAGALAQDALMLLISRGIESVGFMAIVLPGPALLARAVPPARLRAVMGLWGCYMPTGMGLVLLLGPLLLAAADWRALWWLMAVVPLGLAVLLRVIMDPDPGQAVSRGSNRHGADRLGTDRPGADSPGSNSATVPSPGGGPGRLVLETLRSPGAWLLAIAFGCYAGQWMSVMGFLPTFYGSVGIAPAMAGFLTAIGALINVSGNFASGLLLQRGVPAGRLVLTASLTMLTCAWCLFGSDLPFAVRYAALLLFSAIGGLIPGTLFALTHRFAPSPAAISTTTGLMQQGSSLGQFLLPPLVALVVSGSGGWSAAWLATGSLALVNVALAGVLLHWRRQR